MGRKRQELVIKRLEHLENSELGCRLEGLAVAAKTQGVKTHQLLFSPPLSECAIGQMAPEAGRPLGYPSCSGQGLLTAKQLFLYKGQGALEG